MKVKLFTLLASASAMTMAGAFTIDFNTLQVSDGVTTSGFTMSDVSAGNPQLVNVPGYGNVRFEVGPATSDVLTVGSTYSNDGGTTFQQSLEIGADEKVIVTFLGVEALDVDFDIIGIGSGENSAPVKSFSTFNEYEYFPGDAGPGTSGDGTGIAAISWTTVPEPSSSLLVLVGAGSLMLRRRR